MGYSQTADLKIPPPPIPFAPWQTIVETERRTEYLATFQSAVASAYPENQTVPLRIFVPKKATPVPVVLVLHYLGAKDLRLELSLADELNQRGIAAAILTLPYHLSRTPKGSASGEMAITSDVAEIRSNLVQAVSDARRSIDFLSTRPEFASGQVAISGTSLGALVSSLTYGVDERLTRAAFVLGGADLAHILWNSSRVVTQRDALRTKGYTESRLRSELAEVEPLNFFSGKTGDTLLVTAKFDTVIPPGASDKLAEALPGVQRVQLDTGHYGGIFVQRKILREVAKFLSSSFERKPYVAPDRLVAPTLRVGVQLSSGTGFNVGVGLDLLKFDKEGKTFASLFATPQGPQLVLGHRLDRGFSIAFSTSIKRTGIGILWSSVL